MTGAPKMCSITCTKKDLVDIVVEWRAKWSAWHPEMDDGNRGALAASPWRRTRVLAGPGQRSTTLPHLNALSLYSFAGRVQSHPHPHPRRQPLAPLLPARPVV